MYDTHRTMNESVRALVLVGVLAASVCACTARTDEKSRGDATGPVALWEPIDKDFKGCEGG